MLTIVCGEDIAASRRYFESLRKEYQKKGCTLVSINPSEIGSLHQNDGIVVDLFGRENVYETQQLSNVYKGRGKSEIKTTIERIAADKQTVLIDWERGKSAYELSTIKKIATSFSESKPAKNVFQLLELVLPGYAPLFITTLREVVVTQEPLFIYSLLWRHVRKLILAGEGMLDTKTAPWQRAKLTKQSNMWNQDRLFGLYEGLIKIDVSTKTSAGVFDISQSIELLACYYLT